MVTSLRSYDSQIFPGAHLFPFVALWQSRRIRVSSKKSVEQIKDPRLISANDGDAGYFPESDVMHEKLEVFEKFLLWIYARLQKKRQR